MANIIDLSVLEKEPLEIKMKNGDLFIIPGEISTKFTMKMFKYAQDVEKVKDQTKAFQQMQQLVLDILSLDKSKDIDIKYVEDNLDDVRYLKIIIEGIFKHIDKISKDPN